MKIKYIIFMLFLVFYFYAENNTDFLNYDFFGYKLHYNIKELEKVLKSKGIDYIIRSEGDPYGLEFTIVEPKNQNRIEGINLDFMAVFYEGKIMSISKFEESQKSFDKIVREFGSPKTREDKYAKYYDWVMGNFSISVSKDNNKLNYSIDIINNLILSQVERKREMIERGEEYIYKSKVSSLRLRESPSLDGKFIRSLNQGEKLELIEKGKEETVNNVKGTWVKVITEKGEVGWCFDAYLQPYDELKKK